MLLAVWVWRQHPNEIEASIRKEYPNDDIMDWHRGTMSSRRLLVLIEGLSDRSPYKREISATGWPEDTEILAKLHEVSSMNLMVKYAGSPNAPDFKVFIPPKDRLARFMEEEDEVAFSEQLTDELFQSLEWS